MVELLEYWYSWPTTSKWQMIVVEVMEVIGPLVASVVIPWTGTNKGDNKMLLSVPLLYWNAAKMVKMVNWTNQLIRVFNFSEHVLCDQLALKHTIQCMNTATTYNHRISVENTEQKLMNIVWERTSLVQLWCSRVKTCLHVSVRWASTLLWTLSVTE